MGQSGIVLKQLNTHMTLMTTSDCPTAGSGFHRCSCKHNVGYWVFIGVCLEYRVAAVEVMVGDHHTTQDREDMVAGVCNFPCLLV